MSRSSLDTNQLVAQVTTRGAQIQQEEEEGSNRLTCLYVGADHRK
jgi:hypothetical protein